MTQFRTAMLAGALALASGQADAADKPPPMRVYLSQLDVIRYNPLGLESQNRLMWERRLMDSESVLFSNTFSAAGLNLKVNPAFVKVGPQIEIQPIALLNLRATYEYMQFFGTFDYMQSWPEPLDPALLSDDAREANGAEAYVTAGHHVFGEATLMAKGGPVVVRSKFALEYWRMNVEDGDVAWYDATLDTFVPAEGWVWTNDSDLLYMRDNLTAGVRFTGVFPQLDGVQLARDAADANHKRVGPLVAYRLHDDPERALTRPTVLGILGWYVDHPTRQGALPYILVGFSFGKDLKVWE